MIKSAVEALKQAGSFFKLEPFATIIQPIIQDVLAEHRKDKYRKGTILTPLIMVWLVLTRLSLFEMIIFKYFYKNR